MKHDPISEAQAALREAASQAASLADDRTAIDRLTEALERAAAALEEVRGTERLLAAQQALLDRRVLRIETNRLYALWASAAGRALRAYRRVSRFLPDAQSSEENYAIWTAHEQALLPSPEAARAAIAGWEWRPRISVLLPNENDDALVSSLRSQIYPEWEVCVHPDGLHAAAQGASGDYVALSDGPGVLSPYALYYCAEALRDSACEVLYTDEDHLDDRGRRVWPVLKPGWSPVLLRSCMYIGRFVLVRRERLLQMSGAQTGAGEAWLHELLLQIAAGRPLVHHVPRVLYHRRMKPAACGPSVNAPDRQRMPTAMTAIICSRSPALVEKCLTSLRRTAADVVREIVVVAHEEGGPNDQLRAAARNHDAAIVPFSGAFNFAAMSNAGAAVARTEALLFLNDDVEASRAGWAEMLGAHLADAVTGIAGALLRYPDGRVQHAGIAVGIIDGVGHAGRHVAGETALWPWLLRTREVSAVTGACLAIRRELFEELGGFDPAFPNNYNDVDLCFRCRARGFTVLCVAVEGLVHRECQTRRGIVHFDERSRFYQRWREVLSRPDPWHSISLAPAEEIALNLANEQGIRSVLSEDARMR